MSGQQEQDPGQRSSQPTGPSFSSTQFVRFDSLVDSKDLGAWESLKAELHGEIGAATGTQSLFFRFRALVPGRIRVRLEASDPWTDRFLQVSLLDESKKGIQLDDSGYARGSNTGQADAGIMPPGEYRIVLSSSQWQRARFAISLGLNPRELLAIAMTGRGGLGQPAVTIPVIILTGALKGQGRIGGSGGGGTLWSGRQDRPLGRGPMGGQGRIFGSLSTRIGTNVLGAARMTALGTLGESRVLTSTGGSRFWLSRLTTSAEVAYDTRGEVCLFPNGDTVQVFILTPAGNALQYFVFVKRDIKGQVLWVRRVQDPRVDAYPHPASYTLYPLPNGETLVLGMRVSLNDPVHGSGGLGALHVGKLTSTGAWAYYNVQTSTINVPTGIGTRFSFQGITHAAYHAGIGMVMVSGFVRGGWIGFGSFLPRFLPAIGRIDPTTGNFSFTVLTGFPEEQENLAGSVNGATYESNGICVQPNGRVFYLGLHGGSLNYNYVIDLSSDYTQIIRAFQYTDGSTLFFGSANTAIGPDDRLYMLSGSSALVIYDTNLQLIAYHPARSGYPSFLGGTSKDLKFDADGALHAAYRDTVTIDLDGEVVYRESTATVNPANFAQIRDLPNSINAPILDADLRWHVHQYGRQAFSAPGGHLVTLMGHEIDMPAVTLSTDGAATYTAGRRTSATGFIPTNSRLATFLRYPLTLTLRPGTVTPLATATTPTLLNAGSSIVFTLTSDSTLRGTGSIYPSPMSDVSPNVEPDPYGNFVSLHLPMSGMPDTNVFTDYSIYNHPVSGFDHAELSTVQARYPDLGGNYETVSCYLDGINDYLSAPTHPAFQFRRSDFIIETYMYLVSATPAAIFENGPVGSPGARTNAFVWYLNSSRQMLVYANSTAWTTSNNVVPLNQWVHLALIRAKGVWRMFISGVPDPNAFRLDIDLTAGGCVIGRYCDTTNNMLNAYLQDFRITSGYPRFTRRFRPRSTPIQYTPIPLPAVVTPPAEPAEVAGTVPDDEYNNLVLFIRGNGTGSTFSDDSRYAHTVTAWGNATQVAGAGKWGGAAARLDGDGDYLSVPSNAVLALGSGDYTVSVSITRTGNATGDDAPQVVLDCRTAEPSSQFCLRINRASTGRQLCLFVNGILRIVGSPVVLNTRYHVRVCRSNGVTRLFMNGVQVGNSWTDSTNFTSTNWVIGRGALQVNGNWWHFLGDFNDLRILTGRALSTSNFTPPTQAFGPPPNNAYRYIRLSNFAATGLSSNLFYVAEIQLYDTDGNLITGVTATSNFDWNSTNALPQLTDGVLTTTVFRNTWSSYQPTAVIDLDLGSPKAVKFIRIYGRYEAGQTYFPAAFNISGSSTSGAGYGPVWSVTVGSQATWTPVTGVISETGLKTVYMF